MFCEKNKVNSTTFGKRIENDEDPYMTAWNEVHILAGFASFVLKYPRKKGKEHNTIEHAERAVSSDCQHHELIYGRSPGKAYGVVYSNLLPQVFKGLRKIHPSKKTQHTPVMADHMRQIKRTLDLSNLRDANVCALWLSQWQGVLRASDILRPSMDQKRSWNPKRDTHLARFSWEKVDDVEMPGYKWRLRWVLRPNKTNQSGDKPDDRTFILDNDRKPLSAAKAIDHMLYLRGINHNTDKENKSVFMDPKTPKGIQHR